MFYTIYSKKWGKYTELYVMMMKIFRDVAFLLGKSACNCILTTNWPVLQNWTANPLIPTKILVFWTSLWEKWNPWIQSFLQEIYEVQNLIIVAISASVIVINCTPFILEASYRYYKTKCEEESAKRRGLKRSPKERERLLRVNIICFPSPLTISYLRVTIFCGY